MKSITTLFEEFRSVEGLSILVSTEFSNNDSTPIFELVRNLSNAYPPLLDYLLLCSCTLMKELWLILISNKEYMDYVSNETMNTGLEYFNLFQIKHFNNIKNESSDSLDNLIIYPLQVTNSQFEFVSSLNSYFEETLKYLKNDNSCLSAAISLSMFSEYFSNCGVREYGHVDTKWMYSDELIHHLSNISDNNLKGLGLLNYYHAHPMEINR